MVTEGPILRRNRSLVVALAALILAGCSATFNNWVKVSAETSDASNETRARLFAMVSEIARAQGLVPDPKNSAPPLRQGWFGPKYHYYSYELRTVDGKDVAVFVHQAHSSSPRKRHEDPERTFLTQAARAFGPDHVETHFEERTSK